MKRYKIEYTNKRGRKITAISRGKNSEAAFSKYADRLIFGNQIFCNYITKMYDADTCGEKWAQILADNETMVMVELAN